MLALRSRSAPLLRGALLFCAVACACLGCSPAAGPPPPSGPAETAPAASTNVRPVARTAEELWAEQQRLNETLWANEELAQRYEETFIQLWDDLRSAKDAWPVLEKFSFQRLETPTAGPEADLGGGIRRQSLTTGPVVVDAADWLARIAELRRQGFTLFESEWHHAAFTPATGAEPARSQFTFLLHLTQDSAERRTAIRGKLEVAWSAERDLRGNFRVATLAAREVTLVERRGAPWFRPLLSVDPGKSPGGNVLLTPVLCRDLDGDGLSEIVLGRQNARYANRGGGQFQREPLCAHPAPLTEAACLADFTGDGRVDLAAVGTDGGLRLYSGDAVGQFPDPPRGLGEPKLPHAVVATAGDIDGDGDLDLWIGQYRTAYYEGQMPTPYYDANDGYPAALFINEGGGAFREATDAAGLGVKRLRRTYSASFVDLDDDHDLDLLVVSDYAGVDLYRNDGQGRFALDTSSWLDEWHNFGMGHAFGDFDLDGQLDFYVCGMGSTTARRLDFMGLKREDRPDYNQMRSVMGYGNRMYLRRGTRFEEPSFRDEVARAGWTWGATALDFDNDGDRDLFVVNGNVSGQSCKDYCSQYWRHDLYTGASQPDPEVERALSAAQKLLVNRAISHNGFEHKVLYRNQSGRGFVNVGFAVGAAQEWDTRGTLSDDLDGDGRVDLLLVEIRKDPRTQVVTQALHVLRNESPLAHHWIGVRLREGGPGGSPIGARITLRTVAEVQPACVVTGDSLYVQHAPVAHFGLGATTAVE